MSIDSVTPASRPKVCVFIRYYQKRHQIVARFPNVDHARSVLPESGYACDACS